MDLPALKLSDSSAIPSESSPKRNSFLEHNIPKDSTPLIFAFFNLKPESGIVLPTGAYIVVSPSLAFFAPQTTSSFSSPISTKHN